jgi:hypothetical protein
MTIVEAIGTANKGQKVKRATGKVSFVKSDKTVVRLSKGDYDATDWVVSVPSKKKTIKTPKFTAENVKVYKALYVETK